MQKTFIFSALAALLCLSAQTASAAGAYFVDDASIVDPGMVQIESWFSHSDKNENLGTADVAYQLLPNAEFTLLNAYDAQTSGNVDTAEAQVKYQWRNGDGGKDIASSAVLGINQDAIANRFSGLYAYIPSTWKLNETFAFNADLGWQYTAETGRNYLTGGVGSELHIDDVLSFVGEVFDEGVERPGFQLGTRLAPTDKLSFDLIYGRDITGSSANWATVGMTITF